MDAASLGMATARALYESALKTKLRHTCRGSSQCMSFFNNLSRSRHVCTYLLTDTHLLRPVRPARDLAHLKRLSLLGRGILPQLLQPSRYLPKRCAWHIRCKGRGRRPVESNLWQLPVLVDKEVGHAWRTSRKACLAYLGCLRAP